MTKQKQFWLLKTEGDVYPISQLKKEGKTPWSGVRSFAARNNMRDKMSIGDLCLFYHSSSNANGVYGIARVASAPYPDPSQFDENSPYFDARSKKEKPQWILVDIAFEDEFESPVLLDDLKKDPFLQSMVLFQNSRLSIQPVSQEHFSIIAKRNRTL